MLTRSTIRLTAPVALAIALASLPAVPDLSVGGLHWSAALAKDGGSGGGHGGSSGGHGGSGGSGHDGGGDGGSHGGSGDGGSDHSGSNGRDGGSNGNGSSHGSGRRGGGDDSAHAEDHASTGSADSHGRRSRSAHEVRAEVNGANIEVTTADGFKQEIENGRFEMKDPQGRTVVERRATEADRAHLMQFVR